MAMLREEKEAGTITNYHKDPFRTGQNWPEQKLRATENISM
jgi:hypothetical protein